MPNPVVEALKALQVIDKDVWALRRRRDERPRVLDAKRREVEQRRAALAAQKEARLAQDKEADRANLDLKTAEEALKKFQVAMNTAKTNKEYQALQNQIGEKKAELGKYEDRVLAAMAKSEQIGAEHARAETECKKTEGELAALDKEVKAEVADLDRRLADLGAKRDAIAQKIEPEALARYDQILQARGGQALALVIKGACQGCGKTLTPQDQNLLLKSSGIIYCRNCSRICYPADDAWDIVGQHQKA